MQQYLALLAAVLPVALAANADTYPGYEYGNMFYLGPTTGGQYFTRATYSLIPPNPPTDYRKSNTEKEWLSLWIGVQDASSDVLNENFVQPLLNWAPDQEMAGCSADVDHWCAAASTYTPGGQKGQTYVPIPSNAKLDFEISVTSAGSIRQVISMDGSVVSQQTDSSGMKPAVFYSGTECYDDGCGTLAAYSWSNITLVLNKADRQLSERLTLTGATSSGMDSNDGGKTWTIESIEIEKQNLTA